MENETYINFFGVPRKVLKKRTTARGTFAKIKGYPDEVKITEKNICNARGYSKENKLISWRTA